jgi:hypothetical protein
LSGVSAAVVIAAPLKNPFHRILLLLPQQSLLVISALGALSAIISGHFADGVVRPWGFIMADQFPIILSAILYSVSIVYLATNRQLES